MEPLVVDVRDEAAVKGAIAETVARFGSLDIVVNNASAISLTPVAQPQRNWCGVRSMIST